MAALYLHNAIHSPDHSEAHGAQPPHIRNLSTLSSTTLRTVSDSSHPTEPLLSDSAAYLDLLSHQPTHPSDPQPGWDTGITLAPDTASSRGRNAHWERKTRRRLKRLKLMKIALEVLIGGWGIYTTVRYFLAYATYASMNSQAVALALGTSSAISFSLLLCATLLSLCQSFLRAQEIPLHFILTTRTVLHYLSSLFLVGPTIVNLILLFLWKDSTDVQINIRMRCHPDVDVVWPISGQCQSIWGVWLTLSLARMVVTLSITALYHLISSAYHHTKRPSGRGKLRFRPGHRYQKSSFTSPSITSPPMTEISPTSYALPLSAGYSYPQHQTSYSTLGSRSNSNSKYSSEEVPGDLDGYTSPDLDAGTGNSSAAPHGEHERELTGFVDRFRSLVTQITRETEAGLEFSRPEYDEVLDDEGYYPAPLPPTLGYDEFGRPYPPDEHVQILNGYIRRMPTIESMGSREIGSALSSVHKRDSVKSSYLPSRPSTRATMLSRTEYTGSEPPSRTNSVSLGAGLRASEVGELVDRTHPHPDRDRELMGARRNGSTGSSCSNPLRSGASYPSTTYSSASFYTATSAGGSAVQSPVSEFGYTVPP